MIKWRRINALRNWHGGKDHHAHCRESMVSGDITQELSTLKIQEEEVLRAIRLASDDAVDLMILAGVLLLAAGANSKERCQARHPAKVTVVCSPLRNVRRNADRTCRR